jgi:alpha-L-arabinofuranosidase
VIGTVGPFSEGADYVEGWEIAADLKVPMVDEHYYQPPGWFINNQDYYDNYDRSKSKVYLGEYAASLPGGNKTNWETSLAEALYLIGVERNGDVVQMTSYAPLLAREGHTQWNPDLIYFNNTEVKPTIGYFVQQLYGQNAGDKYVPSQVKLSAQGSDVAKRIAVSVVLDTKTGDLIVKLVNILPIEVKTEFDLSGMALEGRKVVKTTLNGAPSDKKLQPVTIETTLDNDGLKLEAYSFTVLRIKKD